MNLIKQVADRSDRSGQMRLKSLQLIASGSIEERMLGELVEAFDYWKANKKVGSIAAYLCDAEARGARTEAAQ